MMDLRYVLALGGRTYLVLQGWRVELKSRVKDSLDCLA